MIFTCEQCAIKFERNYGRVLRFCSQRCAAARNIKERQSRMCEQCNGEYVRKHDKEDAYRFCSLACYWESKKSAMAGANHPNWRGGITDPKHRDRIRFQREVQPLVFERDNYTCQICKRRGVYLHADHKKSWVDYPELRFEPNNCRTLCRECHYFVTFGKKMPANSRWGITKFMKVGA